MKVLIYLVGRREGKFGDMLAFNVTYGRVMFEYAAYHNLLVGFGYDFARLNAGEKQRLVTKLKQNTFPHLSVSEDRRGRWGVDGLGVNVDDDNHDVYVMGS